MSTATDRLQQDRIAFRHAPRCIAMRAAVLKAMSELSTAWYWPSIQRDRDVDHREAERPALQIFAHALLDRADELARHGAADDLVVEFEARAARQRLDLDMDVAELAVAARSGA